MGLSAPGGATHRAKGSVACARGASIRSRSGTGGSASEALHFQPHVRGFQRRLRKFRRGRRNRQQPAHPDARSVPVGHQRTPRFTQREPQAKQLAPGGKQLAPSLP